MNQILQLYLEDFAAGQSFAGTRRVVNQEDFSCFAALTGDAHPIHYDADYAARTKFGRPLAHGLLVMAWSALGATEMSQRLEASMIALIEQGCAFLAPVFVGDEITPRFVVDSVELPAAQSGGRLRINVEIIKADSTVCLRGFHVYQIKCRGRDGGTTS